MPYGTRAMEAALPWVAAGALVALSGIVYVTQRRLWEQDMRNRKGD